MAKTVLDQFPIKFCIKYFFPVTFLTKKILMLKKCMQDSCRVLVYKIHGIYVFYHKANVFVDKKKVNKYYVSTIIIRMTIFHNIIFTKYYYIVVSRFILHNLNLLTAF